MRLLAAGLCAMLMVGCAHTPDLTPQSPATVAPTKALMYPPIGGPGILGVVETVYENAIKQEIALATEARTPGENKITIVMFEGKGDDGSGAGLKDVPFTEINLTEEALAAWPNSGMGVSPYYVQNDYGPFGYAVGRPATGDTCIYAWQRIAPALKPSGAIARGAVVIRLQLCDRTRSEESLLNVMYQLRVNGPVYEPNMAPPQIGRIAVPIRPEGADGFTPVIKVAPQPQVTRRATAAPVIQPVVILAPPVGAPIVPSPTGGRSGGPIVPSPSGAATGLPSPTTSSVTVPRPPSSATSCLPFPQSQANPLCPNP